MQAIHSNWTKPRTDRTGSFHIDDFEILTTILSALKWREHNGKIKMATDSLGLDFYKSRDLCCVWDEVTTELDDIPEFVNAEMFWAAGKIYSLKNTTAPIAVMDTDFIVWDKLAFDKLNDITVIHREELYPDVYPDFSAFNMDSEYIFDKSYNASVKPLNCAFYVLKNEQLKNRYVKDAEKFIKHAKAGDNLTYMVFAEQRLLGLCADLLGIRVDEFSTIEKLFKDGERYFTHTWGMKEQMRQNEQLRHDFCRRCIDRINSDFGEFMPILKEIPELKIYF